MARHVGLFDIPPPAAAPASTFTPLDGHRDGTPVTKKAKSYQPTIFEHKQARNEVSQYFTNQAKLAKKRGSLNDSKTSSRNAQPQLMFVCGPY